MNLRTVRVLVLAVLFVFLFIAIRLTLKPINSLDYEIHIEALHKFWAGRDPYTVTGYYDPPWATFIIAPLVNQPLETWLAISVTLFIVAVLDLGSPAALLLLIHPIFITLIASSNPEWLYVGPGLWLLCYTPRGWGRGIAWLFLAVKPQTTFLLLAFDGVQAVRQRDGQAFAALLVPMLGAWALYPGYLNQFSKRLDIEWSATVIFHYGIGGALLVTLVIMALRRHRWRDYKTLGLLLAPVWSPYLLQYGYTAVLFTLRNASWLRIIVYVIAGILLAVLYWRDFHVAEQLGTLGMLLLAALLAPASSWRARA